MTAHTDFAQTDLAQDLIEDSKEAVMSVLNGEGHIIAKIMHITKMLIEHVDSISQLKPQAKKNLIIAVIHQVIDEDEGPLDAFDDIIKPMVSAAIDEFIEVNKNGLRVAMPTKKSCTPNCVAGCLTRACQS